MKPNADKTRERLIKAATRGFAEQGVHSASLLEITRQAGQRNRGAVHYHFGSREGMLVAVLEQQVQLLAEREKELMATALAGPDDDLVSVVTAFVRPAVELGDLGWEGRCYLMILAELVEDDPDSLHPGVIEVLTKAGGYAAYGLMEQRMPAMPEDIKAERMSLVTGFLLRATADRARAGERAGPSRPQLPAEPFATNLISMVVSMLTAPLT